MNDTELHPDILSFTVNLFKAVHNMCSLLLPSC